MYSQTVQTYMPSVMRTFALSLAVSVLGMALGTFIPPSLFLPLAILEIAMLMEQSSCGGKNLSGTHSCIVLR